MGESVYENKTCVRENNLESEEEKEQLSVCQGKLSNPQTMLVQIKVNRTGRKRRQWGRGTKSREAGEMEGDEKGREGESREKGEGRAGSRGRGEQGEGGGESREKGRAGRRRQAKMRKVTRYVEVRQLQNTPLLHINSPFIT
ncbi:hypothetical protein Pmani_000113 [Petrolisthes manimaculis]|uniref:Uncharacterized protein n=1 Tax=Petrolisthes manimaculis TaxID=1843537 RepID=A0AAE1QMP3_9EUCA|nr:hypothetical protein Pmani_000113 [Petrolisthes manimaculis]